ncbi:MAG: DNA-binding response regulator [Gammaproteobacteria bacterium]|nr:MAG: DNA-binding response regulator [Pseudomonadota bacterium]PIE38772.1 MAG: DNA-binding response regulator [Gammaproteobacteria bacterium]
MDKMNIAIIEDEPDILDMLVYNLNRAGFDTISSPDGKEGLKLIQETGPDLILLDLMLPGLSGFELCKKLKSAPETRHTPIIMVTARGEETDIVKGLETGADDYVTKPFKSKELIARINAALRRNRKPSEEASSKTTDGEASQKVVIGKLVVDADKHEASFEGTPIKLTATEFRLLFELARQPGRVFTREQLINKAFGNDAMVVDRNIDVHIRAIRKKMGDSESFIETIRGVGYRFKDINRIPV